MDSSAASKQTLQTGGVDDEAVADGQLRVLVVDNDQACLSALEETLHSCNYYGRFELAVTKCENGKEVLSIFREDRNRFDLIITERRLLDMDGLELIKHIGELYADFPVIVISSEDSEEAIKEAIFSGACEYLVKPIQIQDVRHLWKHAYLFRKKNTSRVTGEQSGSCNEKGPLDGGHTSGTECSKCSKRRESKELGEVPNSDDASVPARKKQRVIWSNDLHEKFVAAVGQFGINRAVPKKILEIMNVPGLTRENVASHLQKFRQYQKRSEERNNHNERAAAFMSHQEAHTIEVSSPIDGHNFLAQSALLGQQIVQAPSIKQEEGEYGRLTTDCDNSSMFEFEMRQQAINGGTLVISDHRQDHQVNNTFESRATVPLHHQPILEQLIAEHGSRFLSLPSTTLGTFSVAGADGGYYNGGETQVQMKTFEDFATNNDLSAASMFALAEEMSVTNVIEGGHEIILEDGNDNNICDPMSTAYPIMDSGVDVVELPWNGVTTEGSFMDMETSTIGGQCNCGSLENFSARNPNDSFEQAFDLYLRHVSESLNQNELVTEPFEQQGVGFQQEANMEGSSLG
ncbi:hypothetical protein Ancab_021820 [Ancistrocladus abbreviatus]